MTTTLERPPATAAQPAAVPAGAVPRPVPRHADDLNADQPRSIGGASFSDRASLVASLGGSLAFVWIAYERIFAWTGTLGFLVCWYAVFLVMLAGITALSNPRPIVVDRLVSGAISGGAAVVGFALATTVIFIFVKGWPALHHLNFYIHDMSGVRPTAPLTRGGVSHAIVGTVIQVGIAVLISLPMGLVTAVYITEVGGRLAKVVRTVIEAMTALPDILAGLFVYAFLIIGLHMAKTGFAAAIALSVTMVPIIARSAEVTLRVVPGGLREAGLALGASQWQVVRRVVLPTARSGLATALILGIARIAGETAPLLIVSGASTFMNTNPFKDPMNSLPLYIFTAVRSGEPEFIARAYGAAALLLVLVLVLFVLTRYLARDKVRSR